MTVPNTISVRTYQGNGVATEFPTDITVLDTAHVQVSLRDAAGERVVTDYTVSGVPGAVTVTFTTAPSADEAVVIARRLTPLQTLDLENNQAFYPEGVETALDLLTMAVQQTMEDLEASIRVPIGERLASRIAQRSLRADHFLGFDENGELTLVESLLSRDNIFTGTNTFRGAVYFIVGDGSLANLAELHDEVEQQLPTSSPPGNKVWKTDESGNPGWRDDAVADGDVTIQQTLQVLDIHDDISTRIGVVADADRIPLSDESLSGDPNRYATASQLAGYVEGQLAAWLLRVPAANPGTNKVWKTDGSSAPGWRDEAVFDLHEDTSTSVDALADDDRFVVSDESLSGAPNRHVTARALGTYMEGLVLPDDVITLDKLAHGTAGDIFYFDSAGAPQRLAKGVDGQVLSLVNGIPEWVEARVKENTVLAQLTTITEPGDVPNNGGTYTLLSLNITPSATTSLIAFEVFLPDWQVTSERLQLVIYNGNNPIIYLNKAQEYEDRSEAQNQALTGPNPNPTQGVYTAPGTTAQQTYSLRIRNNGTVTAHNDGGTINPTVQFRATEILVAT